MENIFIKFPRNILVNCAQRVLEEKLFKILAKFPREVLLKCAENISTTQGTRNFQKNPTLVQEPQSLRILKPPEPKRITQRRSRMSGHNVMLAHNYDPKKDASKVAGWYITIKYDGVRGKWNGAEMETRNGLTYTLPDFFIQQLLSIQNPDGTPMELDGELWAGNGTFDYMSGMARRYNNNPEEWKQIKYMIFDTPDTTKPLEERLAMINTALENSPNRANIEQVKFREFDPRKTTIDNELFKVEADGGEGLVLRKPKSMYEFARSHDMLKVKSFYYKEAIVTGYIEGLNKYAGMVGSLHVRSDQFEDEEDSGVTKRVVDFKLGSGLTDRQRTVGNADTSNFNSPSTQNRIDLERRKIAEEMEIDRSGQVYLDLINTINTKSGKVKNDALHQLNTSYNEIPLLGSKVTFRYKELTKDGNPKFPTFVTVRYDL